MIPLVPSHAPTALLAAADVRSGDVLSWLIYLSAVLVVGLAALIWAAFIRKGHRRRKRAHRPQTWEMESGRTEGRPSGRRRRHHHHHREAPRNPTLAESGGLPPVRPVTPPEPPDSGR